MLFVCLFQPLHRLLLGHHGQLRLTLLGAMLALLLLLLLVTWPPSSTFSRLPTQAGRQALLSAAPPTSYRRADGSWARTSRRP